MATLQELELALVNADRAGDEQAARALAFAVSEARKSAPKKPVARQAVDEIGRQIGLTARAGVQGLAGLAGVVTDPITAGLNAVLPESMQMQPVRQAASNLLDIAGVPKPANALERVVGQAAESVAGAAGGAGLAGVAAKALTGAPATLAGQLAAQPAQQLAGAAGAGGASQIAQESGAGPLGQIAAGLAGGVAGARVAAPRGAPVAPTGLVQEGQSVNVPILTSDVRQPSTFIGRFAQATGERIPVAGTGGVRAAQQEARVQAVRDFAREYGADDLAAASDVVMRDLANKRSGLLSRYTVMKSDVINRLSGQPVPVTQATAALDNEIASLRSLNNEGVLPAVAVLEDFKTSIQNQPLANVEQIRKLLGNKLADPSLVGVKDSLEKAAARVYPKLNADMGDFIKATGEARDYTKWRVANQRLSSLVGETRKTALKSALQRGEETPEAVKSLLFSQKPSDVRALYAGLTTTGRAAARAAIVQEAFAKSGGAEALSPTKFANEVSRLGKSTGVFFTGDDQKRIEGLVRVLNATRRAGESSVTPPTGVQALPFVGGAVLTDILGGAGAAVASGLTIGGVARIYESAPVRDALLKMARVKANTPEEAALVKRALAAVQSAQENTQESP